MYGNRGESFPISPQFFNSACMALVHFCFQNQSRAMFAYQTGGFNIIIDVMQCCWSDDNVQMIGIAALMVIGKTSNGIVTFWNIETSILQEIVSAMEFHQENSIVYMIASSALGTLL
jgi:hypothetical protein